MRCLDLLSSESKLFHVDRYPVILCIVLGCKINDNTRITSAVDYPVCDLNPCTIFGLHEGMVDSKYNLNAAVNHKPSKKNIPLYLSR